MRLSLRALLEVAGRNEASRSGSNPGSRTTPSFETMLSHTFRRFDDGDTVTALGYDIVIRRRSAGALDLPSAEIIACDPLKYLETEPFDIDIAPGQYPVVLIVAELRDDNRIAYAMIDISDHDAMRWKRANLQEDEQSNLLHFDAGYPVDSSVGCFMDAQTASVLMDYTHAVMPEDDEFDRSLRNELNRHRKWGYSWANVHLRRDVKIPGAEDLNLVAFETGFGPGLYETWVGLDEDDKVCCVVTDFQVLDLRFNTFRFR